MGKREAKIIKDGLYYYIVDKNRNIHDEYTRFVTEHLEEHKKNRLYHWLILIRLNLHYRIFRRKENLLQKKCVFSEETIKYYLDESKRMSVEDLFDLLSSYDVISFDIFDTALYRKVEYPADIFSIMSSEMKYNDFEKVRKDAEKEARDLSEKKTGSREVTISDIYDVLSRNYGIEKKWKKREVELELDILEPNPYIFAVYKRLIEKQKTVVFMSDMYLTEDIIKEILFKNGYKEYQKIYLSCEYRMRKGDGTLQKELIKDYNGKAIIHVGDSEYADVKKTMEAGIDAFFNPGPNLSYREANMDNLSGSFYRSIINRTLNNGLWDKNLSYEHGFRVGGILAVGFCNYINQIVKSKKIDKILFCARDCDIIHKVYNRFFNDCENDYIQISRYAIMKVTSERYLYDLSERYILRYIDKYRSTKTLEAIFRESGFAYLIDYLEDSDIEKYAFPCSINRKKIERFIFEYKEVIEQHNQEETKAAYKYYKSVIGDAKKILIVDIGWSGTCISALKYFIEKNYPTVSEVYGTLLCSSRNKAITSSIMDGTISSYIYSPFSNMDLTRFMMPGGAAGRNAKKNDLLHMPLEFLFTSLDGSLTGYQIGPNGSIVFDRTEKKPKNITEIMEIQAGILDFAEIFVRDTRQYKALFNVSPYTAFMPLYETIRHEKYCYEVYKNFTYDAFTAPFCEDNNTVKFEELFDGEKKRKNGLNDTEKKKKILFVTPELTYTGTPRSLLRMCKVAKNLGYLPIVWSSKHGPFSIEYEKNKIAVRIVPEGDLRKKEIITEIKKFDMAVCNTIVTDKYAQVCSLYIPVVWYIREATNIPDFINNQKDRIYTLQHSRDIYCVSDYAAKAIAKYTKHKISIVHNCVEDETELASSYSPGTGNKIKFVQFGTMEYRKGYDVLTAAFLAMPKDYQEKSELYYAGGFINSGTPYCAYLFNKIESNKNIHYLGTVRGEENKIKTLSSMDVIVVASRDESCSLVALEGAMLSKPLIVTENVGAKYIVDEKNGIVVKTGDVESLKEALMHMIEKRADLYNMGLHSRKQYEQFASMSSYTIDMQKMFSLTNRKGTLRFKIDALYNKIQNAGAYKLASQINIYVKEMKTYQASEDVIVSLTSHPGRIALVEPCIRSLLNQYSQPQKIIMWLSEEQFPNFESDLPSNVKSLCENKIFEIRWVKDDLKPHKKYFYAMQEYPDLPIIIVDDDVIYEPTLVGRLMASYRKNPDCISCMRANMMMFRKNGMFRDYENWIMDYKLLLDIPSFQLLPTGVGGVLYPPKSIPKKAFDVKAIKEVCLYTDDLWLKMFAVSNGFRTVIPRRRSGYKEIVDAKETALYKLNVDKNNNDVSLKRIVDYFENHGLQANTLLEIMRKDRFC